MKIEPASEKDKEILAELRVLAMQESLEAIGRFDPIRARERFLSAFAAEKTEKIIVDSDLVGFFVLEEYNDHYYLNHLYVIPQWQGQGIGSEIMDIIKERAQAGGKPIRLGALKGSRSNTFYQRHGFCHTHEESFDNYYERQCD